jgi:L-arabinose isomerase
MINATTYEFWFITGSQDLYGDDTLRQVADDSKKIVESLNGGALPFKVVYKPTLKDSTEIHKTLQEANSNPECAGVICWMHTFSPSKMWIRGLSVLDKPLLQLNTQFNEKIPFATMDMDFMNLNQSAHGDREFGFITSRMDIPRKVIAGHWSHASVQKRMATWMRAAAASIDGKKLVIARFGDNMREVAVTDGDKVEAMIRLGWSVPYFGIGDLVAYMEKASKGDIDSRMDEYAKRYVIGPKFNSGAALENIREQAKIETALRAFMKDVGASAFTTNFQDLHGMKQLPGLACQNMMADGFGFAGEGDWKTAAMVRTFKVMANGLNCGTSFMEDYTYHLEEGNKMILGAHMLEVCPSVATSKPTVEVHALGIGGKADPARLVFDGKAGPAICASIVQMGSRFRIVLNELETVSSKEPFPKLPVARVLWKPLPSFETAAESWILAGGGHHTAYSDGLTTEYIRDYAEIIGTELVVIGKGTDVPTIRNELRWNAAAYK